MFTEALEKRRTRQASTRCHAFQGPRLLGVFDQLLQQGRKCRLPRQGYQAAEVGVVADLLAQHVQKQQMTQPLQQGR